MKIWYLYGHGSDNSEAIIIIIILHLIFKSNNHKFNQIYHICLSGNK